MWIGFTICCCCPRCYWTIVSWLIAVLYPFGGLFIALLISLNIADLGGLPEKAAKIYCKCSASQCMFRLLSKYERANTHEWRQFIIYCKRKIIVYISSKIPVETNRTCCTYKRRSNESNREGSLLTLAYFNSWKWYLRFVLSLRWVNLNWNLFVN